MDSLWKISFIVTQIAALVLTVPSLVQNCWYRTMMWSSATKQHIIAAISLSTLDYPYSFTQCWLIKFCITYNFNQLSDKFLFIVQRMRYQKMLCLLYWYIIVFYRNSWWYYFRFYQQGNEQYAYHSHILLKDMVQRNMNLSIWMDIVWKCKDKHDSLFFSSFLSNLMPFRKLFAEFVW